MRGLGVRTTHISAPRPDGQGARKSGEMQDIFKIAIAIEIAILIFQVLHLVHLISAAQRGQDFSPAEMDDDDSSPECRWP